MAGITNLPAEILELIGTHLSSRTIKAAIRTCWLLHDALRHLLWKQLNFPSMTGKLLLSAAKVKENAFRVQYLTLRYPIPEEYCSIHYPNVYYISVDYCSHLLLRLPTYKISPANQDQHHCLLIKSNPQVQDLKLRILNEPPSISFWDTVISCLQKHRRLEFQCHARLPEDTLELFWQTCSLFEELDLKICEKTYLDVLVTFPFPRLRRLTFEVGDCHSRSAIDLDDYLLWIGNAMNLEALAWHVRGDHEFPSDGFIEKLREKTWPHLKSLRMANIDEPDDVWANIIQFLPPLQEFCIKSRLFKDQGFARLQETHFKTLRSLNMQGCLLFSSRMALSVLTECVCLEDFRALYLCAADLKSNNPTNQDWACVGLKHLELYIAGEPDDPESNELVFKQLSRLHQLRLIFLEEWYISPLPVELKGQLIEKGSLQLRLDAGLGHLSTLKRLKIISFDNTHQNMRMEDVKWILENWTSIEDIRGPLSDDEDAQKEMCRMIDETDVSYMPFDFIFGQHF